MNDETKNPETAQTADSEDLHNQNPPQSTPEDAVLPATESPATVDSNSTDSTETSNSSEAESPSDAVQTDAVDSDSTEPNTDGILLKESSGFQLRTLLQQGKAWVRQISWPHCIMRFAGIYFLISAFFAVFYYSFHGDTSYRPILNWHEFRDCISLRNLILLAAGAYVLFSLLKLKFKHTRLDSSLLIVGLVSFSLVTLWRNENIYYCFVMILITAVSSYIALQYDRKCATKKLPFWVTCILLLLLAGGVAFCVASSTIYQYKMYGTSCFDMGIFIQMYHSMINDLSVVTTCERNEFLSHFAIHFSPIYYLLLPFYYFFPHAETLLIAQAVLIAVGVIPLMGICRQYHFKNATTLFFGITYLFCSELIGPCYYHFHENAFLPPLLMWLFYAIEKKKPILIYFFMVLVLFVKEDAPIYIVCIGAYLLFQKNKTGIRKHGAIMAAIGGIYFAVVTGIMNRHAEGVMTSRTYGNLMIDQDAGFGEIIKTVLMDPAYFFSQCIREETFLFFLTVMIPLGLMPFFTKKFSHLFLVLPFLLMNLASGYPYAANIGFQYVFGTGTCLVYATIVNSADFRSRKRQYVAAFTAMASLYCATTLYSGKVAGNRESYLNNQERYEKQDEGLESIPEDASVVCDTFYVPKLANRDEVYEMNDWFAENPSFTDFAIIRLDMDYDYNETQRNKLKEEGYTYYAGIDSVMEIYVSPTYEFAK